MTGRGGPGALARRCGRFLFGDRTGLVLWLVLLAVLGLFWRPTLGLTDSNAVANVLVAVADGTMAVEELRFPLDSVGSGQVQQGLREYEGVVYGRNYGQVALAVPILWALEAITAVADLRLALAGGWSLLVLGAIHQTGVLAGRERAGRLVGAAVGLGLFAGSVALATELDPRLAPVLALQLLNLLAAATLGVFLYRLVGRFQGRRAGLAVGLAAGLATPVAFWATFPKRHVLVATLLVGGLLCFARSRQDDRVAPYARAGAYAAFGFVAWIHAFEGFFMVATLGVVDLATARTDLRQVGLVVAGLALALAPTFATNLLISGSPFIPPRIVGASVGGGVDPSQFAATTDPVVDAALGGRVGGSLVAMVPPLASMVPEEVARILGYVVGSITDGLTAMTDSEVLWHVFVRGGNIEGVGRTVGTYEPAELSVLESMPLFGLLALVPVAVGRRLSLARVPTPASVRSLTPARQTDLLVGALALVLTVVYLARLPLHSQLTVRYLFPVYVLGAYGLVRFRPVAMAVTRKWRPLAASFLVAVLAVVLGAVVGLAALDPARAEAVQAHALLHLAAAVGLGAVAVGRGVLPGRVSDRWVAVAIGSVAGVTVAYYVLAALEYFTLGSYVLDPARVAAEVASVL